MANPAPPPWATSSVTFMQATVVAPDAAGRTLSFVDASGRNRSHAVTSAAVPKLGRLRAGDEVIVVLTGTEPMVQDVRLSQAAPSAPSEPPAPETSADADQAQWTLVPAHEMRPAWPNPYSRYYSGKKPAPKPGPRR
ncbi:MAG TPA: hypothetical protein VMT87_01235 [Vicinamibacteria bacterium]|nr:hypothetical protein [Vicinamibacteria bacterium]